MKDKEFKFLSLGAGVQSSTIFMMSCYGELEKLDAAIFSDTGWEPKAVYQWLKFLRKQGMKYGIPVYVVSTGNLKEYCLTAKMRDRKRPFKMPVFTTHSGMLKRYCTKDFKIIPLERKFRELAGYKPRQRISEGTVEVWKGISFDEMRRASMSSKKWISFYYPLIELNMRRGDCLQWFEKKGFPRPPRSACIGCPYHSNAEWRDMKLNRPDEFQDAVEFDKAIRKCGGMRGDCFLHAKRIPLDEVDFRNDEDKGQLQLFRDECQGVCGV